MNQIRKKNQLFAQSIRKQLRQAFKSKARKRIILAYKREQVIDELNQTFQILNVSGFSKDQFWEKGFIPNRKKYGTPEELIHFVCEKIKKIVCDHQTEEDQQLQIKQYLFEMLPYLIPPLNTDIQELPLVMIELLIYLLRSVEFTNQEKQEFVTKLNYETINKCLLNYFVDNWQEISSNRINDIMVVLFTEMNQFRNIFELYIYNYYKFQFLLDLVIKEILELTHVQRSIYEIMGLENLRFFESIMGNQGVLQDFSLRNSRRKYDKNENVELLVLNKSLFLCNLLLLSPVPNYNMKERKQKLKAILNYLNRKIFLKQNLQDYSAEIEFCLTVLLSKTVDVNQYGQIQLIQAVLNSGVERNSQHYHQKNFEEIEQEVQYDNHCSKKKQLQYQESVQISMRNFENFLNKNKLMMIYQASSQLQFLKYDHVEKWVIQQIRQKQNNIISIENSDLMSRLFNVFTNLLSNHSNQTYRSYDSFRKCSFNQSEVYLLTKIKICKLIGKKGFDQIFNNKNLKHYCQPLAEFLISLVNGLEENSNICSSIEVLYFNSQILSQGLLEQNLQENHESMENESIYLMESFKIHINTLCLKFLQKGYKWLKYAKKQKILLNLILVDYLSFEDCQPYLTIEEEYKFRKNKFSLQDYYQDEESIDEECQSEQSQREEHICAERSQQMDCYKDELRQQDTDKWQQNDYLTHYTMESDHIGKTNENYSDPYHYQHQYSSLTQSFDRYQPKNHYQEDEEIEI